MQSECAGSSTAKCVSDSSDASSSDYHINDGVSGTEEAVRGEKFQGSDPGHVSNQLSEAFISEAMLANKDKAARANASDIARAL